MGGGRNVCKKSNVQINQAAILKAILNKAHKNEDL